ncbi:MAG: hypothetical protein GY805_09160, partial [Chloroflexi bacterium]|nr:hypothetical protein [Chloroflexota bacterium]
MSAEQIKTDPKLTSFFSNNPSFDAATFNFQDADAVNQLNWRGISDKNEVIAELKAYQRLLRLNPDANAAMALRTASGGALGSAHQITAMPQVDFVTQYASALPNGEAGARAMYQRATAVTNATMQTWANIAVTVASPHVNALRVNNLDQNLSDFFQGLPSYQEIFGTLNYCDCEHCKSIFGPAAYLVDLQRIIDSSITSVNAISTGLKFTDRRSDIPQIELTCANTNNLIPYLQIINERLGATVKNLLSLSDPVDKAVATLTYPFNLPFNYPLNQIRSALTSIKTSLPALYEAFGAPETTQAAEQLGLTPESYQLITTAKTDAATLEGYYGLQAGKLNTLIGVDVFTRQTGLTLQQLNDLLYQNLSKAEIDADFPKKFYINNLLGNSYLKITESGTPDDPDQISNLLVANNAGVDRVHRFIRLANDIGWSFADLDWAVTATGAAAQAQPLSAAIPDIARI